MTSSRAACLFFLLALWAELPARAQSTSGMASPEVNRGEQSFDYRITYAVEDGVAPAGIGHRFHYDHPLNDSFRLRALASAVDREGRAFDLTSVVVEALWQFIESEDRGFDSALGARLIVATTGGQPDRFRLQWSAAAEIGERWTLAGAFLTTREFGDNARRGVALEARGEATYDLGPVRVGPQYFGDFNTTADFGSFDEQRHQIGVIFKGKLTEKLRYSAGPLFGVSEAASDFDLRLFLAYAL